MKSKHVWLMILMVMVVACVPHDAWAASAGGAGGAGGSGNFGQGVDTAMTAVNSSMKGLYIFAFVCFVVGLGCFTPMVRSPGWGFAAIVVAMSAASAPSCINSRFQGANLQLGELDTHTSVKVAAIDRPTLPKALKARQLT